MCVPVEKSKMTKYLEDEMEKITVYQGIELGERLTCEGLAQARYTGPIVEFCPDNVGMYVTIKDENTGTLFSAPLEQFEFA